MAHVAYNTGFLALLFFACLCEGAEVDYMQNGSYVPGKVLPGDVNLVEFPLNLEYLEAEFFLFGALGYGLDKVAPELPSGGPPPVGGMKANLSPVVHDIILEFAYQEVGHLRAKKPKLDDKIRDMDNIGGKFFAVFLAIKATVKGFPRPLLNLSTEVFSNAVDAAFLTKLNPPFDPYANSLNYLLASYLIPYVGLTGYVGINPDLQSATARRLVAGLLGVESGQDAVLRALLYERLSEKVEPYPYTVAEFTDKLSILRNRLGHTVDVDEGLVVPKELGAEGKVTGNILAGDMYSLSFSRTPAEILRIVYSTGNESMPGGFFPHGGGGKIALSYLK